MPTLREWRHILAAGAEALLTVPETGTVLRVLPFGPKSLPDLPCGLIQSGNAGQWTDATAGDDLPTTASQFAGVFTLWLVAGDPLSERCQDVLDDLVTQLHRAGGLPACAVDPANPSGFVPVLEGVDAPGIGELGSRPVWWAPARFVVPVSTS